MDQYCFLFMEDHSIKRVKPEKINIVNEEVKYLLVPNNEDKNFFICEPSKYCHIKRAIIRYSIYCYVRYDNDYRYELDEAGKLCNNEESFSITHPEDNITFEVFSSFDLYNAIHSICKMWGANRLFFTDNLDFETNDSLCFIIDQFEIETEYLNGIVDTFKWNNEKHCSAESLCDKIRKVICKEFKIPYIDFMLKEKYFVIENEKWKIKDIEDIKPNQLIGFISDAFTNVSFIEYDDYKIFTKHQLMLFITASSKDIIKEVAFDAERIFNDFAYLQDYDMADVIPVFEIGTNTYFKNDTLTFFLNIHYILRHMDALVALIRGKDYPATEPLTFITINFMVSKCRLDSEPRIIFHKEMLPSLDNFKEYITSCEVK